MRKLFVAGCSVSDYTKVDNVYGEYLAEKLNYEYVHEGAGCGSNFRMWRRITKHIIDGNLSPEDLLVVQYTGIERREFWSRHLVKTLTPNKKEKIREPYDSGELIRFKLGSYTWQKTKQEILLHQLLEENCINEAYDKEMFDTQHLMFQCLLKEFNIRTIFLGAYIKKDIHMQLIPFFEKNYVSCDEMWGDENYLVDIGHFNDNGHRKVAEKIYNLMQVLYERQQNNSI